jgi:hypothetical protein
MYFSSSKRVSGTVSERGHSVILNEVKDLGRRQQRLQILSAAKNDRSK